MTNPNSRIAELIGRHLDGTITGSEVVELTTWVSASDENQAFFDRYNDEQYVQEELNKHYPYDVQLAWKKLVTRANLPGSGRVTYLRWFLSAAAVLVLAVLTWVFFLSKPAVTKQMTPAAVAFKNDIQPGGDRATLQLADGKIIVLDSAGNGALAQQGGTEVLKTGEGDLTYRASESNNESTISYNTLRTPKGGKFAVQLPDGSKVWLNALSSLKYPTAFTGSERRVDITGEAIFEVMKNAKQPFRVHFNDIKGEASMVEVVGTIFNLNAYSDEAMTTTTLIEGKVKVVRGQSAVKNAEAFITPGQQAQIKNDGQIKISKDINTDEITAWKDNVFHFENRTIEDIMRTASRWYDIDVKYEYKPAEGYRVKISRQVPISKMLSYLEAAGGVHFSIEGNTVTVKR